MQASTRARALVVDSDLAALEQISTLLGELGFEVIRATDGVEGLQRFQDELPDVVFLNLTLKRRQGTRVAFEIKRSPHGLVTPLVITSEQDRSQSRVNLLKIHGAADVLTKPYQAEKLRVLADWLLAPRDEGARPLEDPVLDAYAISPDSEGVVALESGSLPYLLARVEEDRQTGVLLVADGPLRRALVLQGGLLVGARSNLPGEQVNRVLLNMRKVTPAQLERLREQSGRDPSDVFALLGFLGIVSDQERQEVLHQHTMLIGLSLFRRAQGLLQFRAGEEPVCRKLDRPLRPTEVAVLGLRRSPALLDLAAGRFVRDPVVFQGAPTDVPLTRQERSVLASIDGERSVKELRELARLARLDIDRPLALLATTGLIKPLRNQTSTTPRIARNEARDARAAGSPRSGHLDRISFVELLGMLGRERATGLLEVEGAFSRRFTLVEGELVRASSTLPGDSIGQVLLAESAIPPAALEEALAIQRESPQRPLGSILIELGRLSLSALHRSLRSQFQRIVDSTFEWCEGRWSFAPAEVTVDWSVSLGLKPDELLRRGAAGAPPAWLEQRWCAPGTRCTPRLIAPLDGSQLTTMEREMGDAIAAGCPIQRLPGMSLRRAFTLQTLLYWVASGMVEVDTGPGEEDSVEVELEPPAVEAPTAAAPGLPPDPDPARAESVRREGEAVLLRKLRSGRPITDADVRRLSSALRATAQAAAAPAPSLPSERVEENEPSFASTLARLADELAGDRRSADAERRALAAETRLLAEEVGRLRERLVHVEAENAALRGAAAGKPAAAGPRARKRARKAPVPPELVEAG